MTTQRLQLLLIHLLVTVAAIMLLVETSTLSLLLVAQGCRVGRTGTGDVGGASPVLRTIRLPLVCFRFDLLKLKSWHVK